MEYINKTIGKYAITRKIGEGGMASVYEGIHEKLGTKVAFKVLSPLLARDPQLRQRFENEANFMASLNHPNITRVLDIEEQDETLIIVMELIEGEGLDDRVKRTGPLSNTEVKVIFTQVLNAFEYAHSKGIVHRDIKPANIFIDKYNQVKILDFGIAKIFGLGNEMTQTGTQMGTPVYMSPEQVRGEKSIDHRSDIYSLGITLYFLLSGKAPYESTEDSSFEIFTKIVNEPIPHLSNNSFYDAIIQKAVSKDRNDRYQMIDEMQKTLYDSGLYTKEESQEEVPRIPSAAAITSSAPRAIFIPAPRLNFRRKVILAIIFLVITVSGVMLWMVYEDFLSNRTQEIDTIEEMEQELELLMEEETMYEPSEDWEMEQELEPLMEEETMYEPSEYWEMEQNP
jgi:eukaryotic-like serine/threonine-protein kinase